MDPYWQKFWTGRANPLHSDDSGAYLDKLAAELKIMFPDNFSSFLDIGCGNGVLYKRLGLDRVRYKGVDFSAAMIEAFKLSHPDADVEVAHAEGFNSSQKYDVVFTHAVLQNIRHQDFPAMLRNNLENLAPGGSIIHAGVLWDKTRTAYESGVMQNPAPPFLRRVANAVATRVGVRRGIGFWYSMKRTKELGKSMGLSAKFHGSIHYPYRFHVVFTRQTAL